MQTLLKFLGLFYVGLSGLSSASATLTSDSFDPIQYLQEETGPLLPLSQPVFEELTSPPNTLLLQNFTQALKAHPSLTGLSFEGTSLTEKALAAFGEALKDNTLQSLSFQGAHIPDGNLSILTTLLQSHSQLTSLDLSGFKWKKNYLKKILKSLKEAPLAILMLTGGSLKSNDIDALAHFLPTFPLKELALNNTNLNNMHLYGLEPVLVSLEKINLAHTKISHSGITALASLIKAAPRLRELDLQGITLSAVEGLPLLEKAVAHSSSLLWLHLNPAELATEPLAQAMAQTLEERRLLFDATHSGFSDDIKATLQSIRQDNPLITSLNLTGQPFNRHGQNLVVKALKTNHTLQRLTLGDIPLSPQDLEALGACYSTHPTLKELVWGGVALRGEGMSILTSPLFASLTYLDLKGAKLGARASSVLLPHLKVLDLTDNAIDDEVFEGLASLLEIHPHLEKLVLDHNPLYTASARRLEAILETNQHLKEVSLQHTPFREGIDIYERLQMIFKNRRLCEPKPEEKVILPSEHPRYFYARKLIEEHIKDEIVLRITGLNIEELRELKGKNTVAQEVKAPDRIVIPEVARGYEEIYERFLKGVLIYRPQEGSDKGKIEMPIAALANPLDGTFDLSRCGDAGRYLSIATGYRKRMKAENANKIEIWFTPRFLIEKEVKTTASHFNGLSWCIGAPVGIFWIWGGCSKLDYFDYLTSQPMNELGSAPLWIKWNDYQRNNGWQGPPSVRSYRVQNFTFML